MEIEVIGPGSVGMLIGGLLHVAGHRVVFRARRSASRARRRIRIVLPDRWLAAEGVKWKGPEEPIGSPDAFLVTLGRHHLQSVRRPDFLRLIGKGQAPVAFFNCDSSLTERLAVPPGRLRPCLSLLTAVSLQEGDVELAPGKAAIVHERSDVLEGCFQDLAGFGLQVVGVDDAGPLLNSLFAAQLLFLPVAMCGTTLASFLSFDAGREIARNMLAEGFAAFDRVGVPLATLPAMDPRELAVRLEKRPRTFDEGGSSPDRGYNTVLQSFLRGRPTEAAHLNRRIVEMASAAGLHLTWNWRVLQKASHVASIGFYRDPGELLRSLA